MTVIGPWRPSPQARVCYRSRCPINSCSVQNSPRADSNPINKLPFPLLAPCIPLDGLYIQKSIDTRLGQQGWRMAQGLSACTAFPQDLSSVPGTHTKRFTTTQGGPTPLASISTLHTRTCTCVLHTHIHTEGQAISLCSLSEEFPA